MSWLLLLQGMGSQMHQLQQLWHMGSAVAAPRLWSTGSVVVAHGLSSSAACGIFPERDQTCVPCIAEKAMAPHSSTFAWKIHGRRSLVGCSPWGREQSDTTERFHFTFLFHALEKEMATHSSVLVWRIPGTAEPGGLPSMRLHRVGHH